MGYKLAWQSAGQSVIATSGAKARELLTLVAEGITDGKTGLLFVDVSPEVLSVELLQAMSQQAPVLIFQRGDLLGVDAASLAASLREQGFGLALRNVDLAFLQTHDPLLPHLTHVVVGRDHPELAKIGEKMPSSLCLVLDDIPGWQEFDECAALGACGFFGNLCLAPRESNAPTRLGPQALQILQLMQMVQGNADMRHLEKVLKSDVTLSYKLLNYINSAGFGLKVEIDSPRHAVAMLGYAPLFRWLLLLLARTNTGRFSPALMQAAMVRGRFAELLGQGVLSKREAENLFVVGMFSILDRMLVIPIKEVLGQLALPEAVAQALISHEGVYGPVLELAEACEREAGGAAEFAEALSMTPAQVNQAHLSALVWVQGIKL